MVTWLEVNHRSANPEAIEDFIFLWPFFCLWSLQILSFGKIFLQVPLCSSLCLAVPCRMSFSSWLWAVKREAVFRVHKANLHGELHIVAFCTSIFSWETQERIDHSHLYFCDKIFCMWIPCFQGRRFGFFKRLGVDVSRALECPVLMASFSLAWVRLKLL